MPATSAPASAARRVKRPAPQPQSSTLVPSPMAAPVMTWWYAGPPQPCGPSHVSAQTLAPDPNNGPHRLALPLEIASLCISSILSPMARSGHAVSETDVGGDEKNRTVHEAAPIRRRPRRRDRCHDARPLAPRRDRMERSITPRTDPRVRPPRPRPCPAELEPQQHIEDQLRRASSVSSAIGSAAGNLSPNWA